MKISGFVQVLIFFAFMMAIGWVINATGILENHTPVNTSFVCDAQVFDVNGSPVPGQTVYFLSCIQKPAGWTTPTSYVNKDVEQGFTDKDGYVELDSINYTLYKNDIVWLGASTNETLLESDYANKTFKPGNIGEWTHYEYRNVSGPGNLATRWASIVLLRNSNGKMIDVNQYGNEHGFNNLLTHPLVKVIDYLNYIDNSSL